MATNVDNKTGEFQIVYAGPYTGVNTMMPENLIPDSATPASADFTFRNSELRSRPAFTGIATASPAPGGFITAVGSLGLNPANSFFAVANNSLYTFNNGGGTWTKQSGATSVQNATWRTFNNVLYIACTNSHLCSWDGTTFTADAAQVAASGVGGVFVSELDNHLVLLNVVEGINVFANRIRWSATSLPAVWDPTVNVNSGFSDLLDVADSITGFLTLGRVGYILRGDGITEMAPTGQGAAPFQFNHLWANQVGLGNTKFYASAAYGSTAAILSRDNIYSIMSYDVQPMGGASRDAIMADIAAATAAIRGISSIYGVMMPYYRSGIVGDIALFSQRNAGIPNYQYLTYMLFINQDNGNCRVWSCNMENQNSWEQYNIPNTAVTGQPSLCLDSTGAPTLILPIFNTQTNQSSFVRIDTQNFNDTAQASSHSFKVEDVVLGHVVSVNRIVLTYRDMGQFTATFTITGCDDNGSIVTAAQTVTLGGLNDSQLKTAFIYPVNANNGPFTGFRPQLTISRAAGAGVVSIASVMMQGRLDRNEIKS